MCVAQSWRQRPSTSVVRAATVARPSPVASNCSRIRADSRSYSSLMPGPISTDISPLRTGGHPCPSPAKRSRYLALLPRLERVRTAFVVADANRIVNARHENLAIADLACSGRVGDGLNHLFGLLIGDHQF